MTTYAVIDTNILVSALLSKLESAATVQIMEQVFQGNLTPVLSPEIFTEYNQVLQRERFAFPPRLVKSLLAFLAATGHWLDLAPTRISLPDPKDIPFYATFLAGRSRGTYLITGNTKHFPKESFILTAREFIDHVFSPPYP